MTAPRLGSIRQGELAEIDLGHAPDDPWAELDLDVVRPDGSAAHFPAFISRGRWTVRYSSEAVGEHRYRIPGSRVESVLSITPRDPDAAGLAHGGVVVTGDRRHFEHADGTPFLWTGDTWWHGFVTAKIGDDEFREFAERRKAEGFTVIQITVMPCEAGPFDEAVRSRSGWSWTEGFGAPNLAWWDDADIRIAALVEAGLSPCIMGSWGFHLAMMDDRTAIRHWREMVARWAAYPITWCLAGEPSGILAAPLDSGEQARRVPADEPLRLSTLIAGMAEAARDQLARLDLVAKTLRGLDPFSRLVTTHVEPVAMPWQMVTDESTLDFWMLQTGHGGVADIPGTVDAVRLAYEHEPVKPVVNGEPSYEGIGGGSWQDVQRMLFWTNMLAGAAGFTYGAHGVWAMNTPAIPGQSSGLAPTWVEASRFPGGFQVGVGARWLREHDVGTLTPRDDLTTPAQGPSDRLLPYCADFADGTRIIYLPRFLVHNTDVLWTVLDVNRLGGRRWRGHYVDPRTGAELPEFDIVPDSDDSAQLRVGKTRPSWEDWLIVLRPES